MERKQRLAKSECTLESSDAPHTLSVETLFARLQSSGKGLSSAEAKKRLRETGRNELHEAESVSPWMLLLAQFKSILIWVLLVAAVISGLVGEWLDCAAILLIIVLNAIIGFYQEFSAERSIAALKKMSAPRANVQRNGRIITVSAAEVVPGDILKLEAGDLVPTDARIITANGLRCVESALTGESASVGKQATILRDPRMPLGDRRNMVFMSSTVASGEGEALVVGTGMNTEIGHIAKLIEQASAHEPTPLQKKLHEFGRLLVWTAIALVAILFLTGLLRGMHILELFMTSVSLAVAAVPEGLPAVVTIALALGVVRMTRRRALIRRLPVVETLGCTNIICSDKTGTLTVGEMTVRALQIGGETFQVTGEGYAPEGRVLWKNNPPDEAQDRILREFARALAGCNNAHLTENSGDWKVVGDPTEGAMLVAATKMGINKEELERQFPKVHEIPFDSDRKRRTVIRRMAEGKLRVFINGAPDVLLDRCAYMLAVNGVQPMSEEMRQVIRDQNAQMAGQALRVLGSAFCDCFSASVEEVLDQDFEQGLVFVGLCGMHDPPRTEAKDAIKRCHQAGIRVVMITGDHPKTALAIARELGITNDESNLLSGSQMDDVSDKDLVHWVQETAVYARVTAEHKMRIIRAWKANRAVVAMTGDGVNDAPAIKAADIGIGMGRTGTEVTKQASDMIVMDDNFASIVAAVEEGRGIYDNIQKTLQYLLASNAGEVFLITICLLTGMPIPLAPIHLLWINLVTDGPPALCLATDPIDRNVMRRKPRRLDQQIIDRTFLTKTILTGIVLALLALFVFRHGLNHYDLDTARSQTFVTLVFAQLFCSFAFRSDSHPIWKVGIFSNKKLALAVGGLLVMQTVILQVPVLSGFLNAVTMPLAESLIFAALGLLPVLVLEMVKVFSRRNHEPR